MNDVDDIKFIKECLIYYYFHDKNAIISLNSFHGLVFVVEKEFFFPLCEIGTNFSTQLI
jgi:hypothetical protein